MCLCADCDVLCDGLCWLCMFGDCVCVVHLCLCDVLCDVTWLFCVCFVVCLRVSVWFCHVLCAVCDLLRAAACAA